MQRQAEIDEILSRVTPWPEEDRAALAYLILRAMRKQTRDAAPRHTLARALGIAKGTTEPPDDATVDRWMDEHRTRKYG